MLEQILPGPIERSATLIFFISCASDIGRIRMRGAVLTVDAGWLFFGAVGQRSGYDGKFPMLACPVQIRHNLRLMHRNIAVCGSKKGQHI
jgi:hypothetical protein